MNTAIHRFLLVLLHVMTGTLMAHASHAELALPGAGSIRGFELYGWNGLLAWSGRPTCSGEFQGLGYLQVSHWLGSPAPAVQADCALSFGTATRDDFYAYFARSLPGGALYRKPLWSLAADLPPTLLVPPSDGRNIGAITLAHGRLFWTDLGATLRILSARTDGTDLQVLAVLPVSQQCRRIVAESYGASLVTPTETLLIHLFNGQLYRLDYATPDATPVLLASGVADFATRHEQLASGGFLRRFTTIYAIVGSAIRRVDLELGSSTVFHATANALQTVAADSSNVYWIEQAPSDVPFGGVRGYQLWRVASDPGNPAGQATAETRQLMDNAPEGSALLSNLRSDEFQLFWAVEDRVMMLPTTAPRLELDLVASGLEIVQTTQNPAQDVPLVVGKPTVVRAYASVQRNTTGTGPFHPSAILRVFSNGQEMGILRPVNSPVVDATTDWAVLRGALSRSFLFELPSDWVREGRLTAEFTVNPAGAIPETGVQPLANNTAFSTVARVVRTGRPTLVFLPMHATTPDYDPRATGSKFGEILARAKSLLPLDDFNVHLWNDRVSKPVVRPSLRVECDPFPPFCFDISFSVVDMDPFDFTAGQDEWNAALFWLDVYQTFETDPGADTHYVGTVSGALQGGSIGGIGRRPGKTTIVRMYPDGPAPWNVPYGGVVLAHELGHNYGRRHINCGGPGGVLEDAYPYDPCQITPRNSPGLEALFGFDPLSRSVVNPVESGDLMSYAATTWTSRFTWDALIGMGPGSRAFRIPGPAEPAPNPSESPVVMLHGMLNRGTDAVTLWPSYAVPPGVIAPEKIESSIGEANAVTEHSYRVELLDAAGALLLDSPLVLHEGEGGNPDLLGIAQILPLPAGVRRVRILHDGEMLAENWTSRHSPGLRLDPPLLVEDGRMLRVSWTAPDPDGDPVLFTIQYSHDDGRTWRSLKSGYPHWSIHLDTGLLPGGRTGRVRVLATDGFNTSIAVSDPVALPRHAPSVLVDGVRDGGRIPYGSRLPIIGAAYDAEEGLLSGPSLRWTLTGPHPATHAGPEFLTPLLPPGAYSVSLVARDADDQTGGVEIRFRIAPALIPEASAPVFDGSGADAAYSGATLVHVPLAAGTLARARWIHADGALYVWVADLPSSANPQAPSSIGILVDTDASGGDLPRADDLGVFVDEHGLPAQLSGDGARWRPVGDPHPGVQARVRHSASGWSAELRIPDSLLGGWDHGVGVAMWFRSGTSTLGAWPPIASEVAPSTWAPVYLGRTLPPLANLPPVAIAGGRRDLDLANDVRVTLDASASHDPEGRAVTYSWTQIAGPPVMLSGSTTARPEFVAARSNAPAMLQFQVVVSDGQLPSAPAFVEVALRPVEMQSIPAGSPADTLDPEGAGLRLTWPGVPGDRVVMEMTTQLDGPWIPFATNSVGFSGILRFPDPDRGQLPQRFYRARSYNRSP